MITYVNGDLLQSPAKVLVNPVNTVGVMGRGLAADFKRIYPEMFEQYHALCSARQLNSGKLHLYRTPHKWILNFPIKKHWRETARLDYLEAGLQKFAVIYAGQGITSASFPLDDDGLDWQRDVRPLVESFLDPLPIMIYIHRGDGLIANRNFRAVTAWLNGTPQAVSFDKVWRDLLRLVKRKTDFQTEDGLAFTVNLDAKARSRSLILGIEGETIFLSESMLSDLWIYIRSAGYSLPDNLPGGMDALSTCLVALLTELDYVQPVSLSVNDEGERTGLHYIPPVQRETGKTVVISNELEV